MSSLAISILSIITGIVIIIFYGVGEGLVGSAWFLSILGAPTTFLYPLPALLILMTGIHKNNYAIPYIITYALFFLQYQFIAFVFYKLQDKLDFKVYMLVLGVIILSACLMYYLQIGRYHPPH